MKKPSRYFVSYEDPALIDKWKQEYPDQAAEPDPTYVWTDRDFELMPPAREFAKTVHGILYERVNIRDETPLGDPRGLLWEWEEKMVEDQA